MIPAALYLGLVGAATLSWAARTFTIGAPASAEWFWLYLTLCWLLPEFWLIVMDPLSHNSPSSIEGGAGGVGSGRRYPLTYELLKLSQRLGALIIFGLLLNGDFGNVFILELGVVALFAIGSGRCHSGPTTNNQQPATPWSILGRIDEALAQISIVAAGYFLLTYGRDALLTGRAVLIAILGLHYSLVVLRENRGLPPGGLHDKLNATLTASAFLLGAWLCR